MMTEAEALNLLERVHQFVDDPETAHMEEDELRYEVLKTIADPNFTNLDHAKRLAQIAIRTEQLHFPRWCA